MSKFFGLKECCKLFAWKIIGTDGDKSVSIAKTEKKTHTSFMNISHLPFFESRCMNGQDIGQESSTNTSTESARFDYQSLAYLQ